MMHGLGCSLTFRVASETSLGAESSSLGGKRSSSLTRGAGGRRAERAATCVRQACEAGALRFLDARVLRSVPMEDEPPEQQELYAHAAHQLLMLFLDAPPGR